MTGDLRIHAFSLKTHKDTQGYAFIIPKLCLVVFQLKSL